mmetsp:Transcript_12443/g.33432  ORF Transcript_12443/g.33432 Transcript_12443/m.33432 type:complete len:423 (-) Transcript_12443:85-1353(-)
MPLELVPTGDAAQARGARERPASHCSLLLDVHQGSLQRKHPRQRSVLRLRPAPAGLRRTPAVPGLLCMREDAVLRLRTLDHRGVILILRLHDEAHPGIVADVDDAQALGGDNFKQAVNEVVHGGRERRPELVRPVGVRRLVLRRKAQAEHNKDHHAHGESISLERVVLALRGACRTSLWVFAGLATPRSKLLTIPDELHLRRRVRACADGRTGGEGLQGLGEAKVADPDRKQLLGLPTHGFSCTPLLCKAHAHARHENVLELQVAMNNAQRVTERHSIRDLSDDVRSLRLLQRRGTLHHVREQVAARNEVRDDEDLLGRLREEGSLQRDHVRVGGELAQGIHLPHGHYLSGLDASRATHKADPQSVDDLDREDGGVPGSEASVHRSVAALSQNLLQGVLLPIASKGFLPLCGEHCEPGGPLS